ncbi:hypothetical protein JRI60_14295 [Archangium violaceum]|uniref:hypothetical protein n=1 Tax=Archangium violaceum TaxID=83451 RepID=UPI001950AE3E|nr:hypothetical protein [Archangium violaceum]QRO00095.1 hypothetical protein JRI60_14295 [Archangium violaceum]
MGISRLQQLAQERQALRRPRLQDKDGGSTHCFRFAKDNSEPPENHYGKWVTPAITTWYELTGDGIGNQEMRNKLNGFNYGSASIKVKDSAFLSFLNTWKPSNYPTFTQQSIEASNPVSKKDGKTVEGASNKAASKKDGRPVEGEGKSGGTEAGR